MASLDNWKKWPAAACGDSVWAETGLWPFQRNRRRRTVLAAGEKRGFRPRAKSACTIAAAQVRLGYCRQRARDAKCARPACVARRQRAMVCAARFQRVLERMRTPGWQFWIDRGGTFTDVIGLSPRGELHIRKLLSVEPGGGGADPGIRGAREILGSAGEPVEAVEAVKVGTTVATNALRERKGAAVPA